MIANSTPLIYLAKIGKLELLRLFFKKIHIPEAVKREVIDQGLQLHEPDAVLVKQAIAEGWIEVKTVTPLKLLKKVGIDQGELEAISLVVEMNEKEILLDQTHARLAAELVGLQPRGTLFVLLTALKKRKISYDDYRSLLEALFQAGFRLSEEVYLQALKLAEQWKR